MGKMKDSLIDQVNASSVSDEPLPWGRVNAILRNITIKQANLARLATTSTPDILVVNSRGRVTVMGPADPITTPSDLQAQNQRLRKQVAELKGQLEERDGTVGQLNRIIEQLEQELVRHDLDRL